VVELRYFGGLAAVRESAQDMAGISLSNKKFEPPRLGEGQRPVGGAGKILEEEVSARG
jgi:hypothetical protein